ncbi:hypothetical protein Esti_001596 [Eimeria stiedai]
MNQGAPSEPYGLGGAPFLSPLGLSLDAPGGPQRDVEEGEEGPPLVVPQLQRQLLQQYRSTRLWLQRVTEERPAAGGPPSFFGVGPLGAPAERETVLGAEDAVLSLATQVTLRIVLFNNKDFFFSGFQLALFLPLSFSFSLALFVPLSFSFPLALFLSLSLSRSLFLPVSLNPFPPLCVSLSLGLQSCVFSVGPPSGPVPSPGAPKPSCCCCLSLPLFCDSDEVAALRHQGPPLPLRERGPQERDWGRPRACNTLLNAEPEDAGGTPSPPSAASAAAAAAANTFGFLGSGGPPYPQEERGPPGTFPGREPPILSAAATAAAAAAVAASQASQQQHRQQQQRQELSALEAQLSRLHSPHSHRGPFVTPASMGVPGGGPHRFFTSGGPRLDERAPIYVDRGPSSSFGLAAGGDVLMGSPARGPLTTEGLLVDGPLNSPSPEELGGPSSLQDSDREVGALVGEDGESLFGDASPGRVVVGALVEAAPTIGAPLQEPSLGEDETALNRQQSSLELELLLQPRDSQRLQPEERDWY